MAKKSGERDRELIDTGKDKRYVRRNDKASQARGRADLGSLAGR